MSVFVDFLVHIFPHSDWIRRDTEYLNAKRYRVSLHIQSKCGRKRTRITPNTDTFLAVTSSNPQIIKSTKTQVMTVCEAIRFLVIVSCFTFPLLHDWLQLQQEAEWVNFNFERSGLNSPQKSYPPPDEFGEICFFVCL